MNLRNLSLYGCLSLATFAAHADTFSASGVNYTDPNGTFTLSPTSTFDAMGNTAQAAYTTYRSNNPVTIFETITIDGISASLPLTISAPVITLGPRPPAGDTSFALYSASVQVGSFLYTENGYGALLDGPGNFTLTGTITPIPSSTTTTPEPSSLFLLGTGLLAAVGTQRHRFRRPA